VVGGEREVRVEEQLQAALGGAVQRSAAARPEEPVVDQHEIGAASRARVKSSTFAETPVTTVWISSLPGTCSPLGRSRRTRWVQELVEVANDLIAGCHRHRHRFVCHIVR
jgi:hypothetical protein